MKSLKDMKQKGRALRKHLESTFGKEVSLSQAYEALAVMEGAENWNVLSSQLAGTCDAKVQRASMVNVTPIRAIFRTVDHSAVALFDASPWFQQAAASDIQALMCETVAQHKAPQGFERSVGAGPVGDAIAAFSAAYSPDLQAVFEHIKASSAAGKDCGGSDCFIQLDDLANWLIGRPGTAAGANVLTTLEVNLHDELEYETPDIPEWRWIEEHHSFAHKGNGVEGGVWEFQVHISQVWDDDAKVFDTSIPQRLIPYFARAVREEAVWVLFHQG